MSIDQKIATIFVSNQSEIWKKFAPHLATKKRFNSDKRQCLAWLNGNDSTTVFYEGTNSEVQTLLIASTFPDVTGPTIMVLHCSSATPLTAPILNRWIRTISDKYPKIDQMLFRVPSNNPDLKKAIEKLDTKIDSHELIGPTTILSLPCPSQFQIGVADNSFDIKPLLAIEKLAHESDPTSRVHGLTKKLKKQTVSLLETCKKHGSLLVAFDKAKPVGFIAIGAHHGIGRIYDIAVHPRYQGNGAARQLYQSANEYFENHCRYYLGATSTSGILKLKDLLQRKTISTNYRTRLNSQ